MYLYGFDIGGTKCAVILAKVEGDQVDFLERYEMKTLGDWKKVLDELSEKMQELWQNGSSGPEKAVRI